MQNGALSKPLNNTTYDRAKITDWSRYRQVAIEMQDVIARRALAAPWEPVWLNQKACLMPQWTQGEITPDRLRIYNASHNTEITGVGLRTGKLSVVDIDCIDDSLTELIAQTMLETLGTNPLCRRGSKGLAALYWNETPIGKLRLAFSKDGVSHAVEQLGVGQQIGGFGKVKSDTKKGTPAFGYTWLDGESPLDVAPCPGSGLMGQIG